MPSKSKAKTGGFGGMKTVASPLIFFLIAKNAILGSRRRLGFITYGLSPYKKHLVLLDAHLRYWAGDREHISATGLSVGSNILVSRLRCV